MSLILTDDGYRIDPALGIIYGRKGKPVGFKTGSGYVGIGDRQKGNRFAHRVIWESVNGKIENNLTINHINGIKTDNRIENLELLTRSDNIRHAHATGLNYQWGEANRIAVTNEKDVIAMRQARKNGWTYKKIAIAYSLNTATVTSICRRESWKKVE